MIQFFKPNTEQLAKGTAVQLALQLGMQTAEPFKISQFVGDGKNPSFSSLKELEGKNWLTSLAISFKGKQIVLEECILSLNQEKNIVTTALQGRNGTIKEYICDGDYQISVAAGVSSFGENSETATDYPTEKLKALYELLSLAETLEVQSDFLEIFGIKSAVVTGFSLEQETHSNRQSIHFQMLSDEPYEIKLRSTEG